MRSAFSLVELSIVLVILGLLTGGILAGQSLIRASELRAAATEASRYVTATHSFRDKYFGLPGDITNAETIWTQLAAATAACRDTASTTAATCNGNGDGDINYSMARSREMYRYWQHLANAGLIEGQYTGSWDGVGSWNVVLGSNIPRSRIGDAGWAVLSRYDAMNQGGWYANIFIPSSSINFLILGSKGTGSFVNSALLKNEEAWNIDTKMDDGRPGIGRVTTFNATQHATCASSDTAASATYQLTVSGNACVLLFGF